MSNLVMRKKRGLYHAQVNPCYFQAPAFSMSGRGAKLLNTLASNNPFFAKTGTHRCPQGEELLTTQGARNDRVLESLIAAGRHWKATPGPGSYRTPRTIGEGELGRDLNLDDVAHPCAPNWSMGTSRRQRFYHTLGTKIFTTKGSWQHEGKLDPPISPYNVVPGPGSYFQTSDCGLSSFTQSFGLGRPRRHDLGSPRR